MNTANTRAYHDWWRGRREEERGRREEERWRMGKEGGGGGRRGRREGWGEVKL